MILGDFAEVNDEIVSNIEESFSEEDLEWQRSDATQVDGSFMKLYLMKEVSTRHLCLHVKESLQQGMMLQSSW